MINLDYQSRIPIYEQIINQVERYIALGIYKPMEQLPSVRELASNLGINPNTVKKAYSELELKGVIVTISTKGTFVSDKTDNIIEAKIDEGIFKINELISELEKLGISRSEIIKKIKKIYGENFMKLCRELFPTLLETEGRLLEVLSLTFVVE